MPSNSAPTGGGWDVPYGQVCGLCGGWFSGYHVCLRPSLSTEPQVTIDYSVNLIRIADALERIAKALEDER